MTGPFWSRDWRQIEALCGVPVAGVVPYTTADIDDEDSLTERFSRDTARKLVDIAVIRLPKISNFTDFSPFERYENVSLRYVDHVGALGTPDMILLPGRRARLPISAGCVSGDWKPRS